MLSEKDVQCNAILQLKTCKIITNNSALSVEDKHLQLTRNAKERSNSV